MPIKEITAYKITAFLFLLSVLITIFLITIISSTLKAKKVFSFVSCTATVKPLLKKKQEQLRRDKSCGIANLQTVAADTGSIQTVAQRTTTQSRCEFSDYYCKMVKASLTHTSAGEQKQDIQHALKPRPTLSYCCSSETGD